MSELITSAEARKLAKVSNTTLRNWTSREWVSAVRVGPRKTLYDRESILAMIRPIGALSDAERAAIAALVAESPDPDATQIVKIRSIIHANGGEATT